MTYVETDFGFSTADADDVRVIFHTAAVSLTFIDWREKPVAVTFRDVLSFRWSSEALCDAPRNDATYEVKDSPELTKEIIANSIPDDQCFVHYKLCFNAIGVLDVLLRKNEPAEIS